MKKIIFVFLVLVVLSSGCIMSGCSQEKFDNCIKLCTGVRISEDTCLKICGAESYGICGEEQTIEYLAKYAQEKVEDEIQNIIDDLDV